MKKLLAVLLVLVLPATTMAAVTISLSDNDVDGNGDNLSYDVTGLSSISVQMYIDASASENVVGYGAFLCDPGSNGIAIIGRAVNSATYTMDAGFNQTLAPGNLLNPVNNADLGGFDATFMGISPSNHLLQTLTLDISAVPQSAIDAGLPIYISDSGVGGTMIWTPDGATQMDFANEVEAPAGGYGVAGPALVLVLEPASALLLLAAVPFLRRRRS